MYCAIIIRGCNHFVLFPAHVSSGENGTVRFSSNIVLTFVSTHEKLAITKSCFLSKKLKLKFYIFIQIAATKYTIHRPSCVVLDSNTRRGEITSVVDISITTLKFLNAVTFIRLNPLRQSVLDIKNDF